MKKMKLVSMGGGTGQSCLLSGLKHNPQLDITAIVSEFDSGGSSGIIRDQFGLLPPGDAGKNIAALAPAEKELFARELLRREKGGHSFLNILISGAERLGIVRNIQGGIDLASDFIGSAAHGRVLAVTLNNANLCANFSNGFIQVSEALIDEMLMVGGEIDKLYLVPRVECNPEALAAIEQADIICIGPGSFYTSVLANLTVQEVSDAIARSKAPIIFVMNLLTEGQGMRGLSAEKIVAILEEYTQRSIDRVIINTTVPPDDLLVHYATELKLPVETTSAVRSDPQYVPVPLWVDFHIARHDPHLLAAAVFTVACQVMFAV